MGIAETTEAELLGGVDNVRALAHTAQNVGPKAQICTSTF